MTTRTREEVPIRFNRCGRPRFYSASAAFAAVLRELGQVQPQDRGTMTGPKIHFCHGCRCWHIGSETREGAEHVG